MIEFLKEDVKEEQREIAAIYSSPEGDRPSLIIEWLEALTWGEDDGTVRPSPFGEED